MEHLKKIKRGIYNDEIVSFIMNPNGSAFVYKDMKPIKVNGETLKLSKC